MDWRKAAEWMNREIRRGRHAFRIFCKWTVLAVLVGAIVAAAGAGFHHMNELARETRLENGWLLYFLPLAGVLIVAMYHRCGIAHDWGTNLTLLAVRGDEPVALRVAPLVSVGTALTHLTGGSSGREGAALQLGSAIANFIGRKLRFDTEDIRILTMCGMSAGFSALFGTPLASAVFAIEAVTVGSMPYAALVPCAAAALSAQQIAMRLHCEATSFALAEVPAVGWGTLGATLVLGCLCGVVAWLECAVFKIMHHWLERRIPNPYIRAAAGGALVVLLTLLLGTRDYNGAGMAGITRAIAGEAAPWAFLCKILLTALTIGAGFKGGEIVPTFFIGATFGCTAGAFLGLPAGFAAALGMVALFCGVTNAPLASVLLAYELFGGEALPLFLLICAVTYQLSGYGGLYSAQQIIYSKEALSPHAAEPEDGEELPGDGAEPAQDDSESTARAGEPLEDGSEPAEYGAASAASGAKAAANGAESAEKAAKAAAGASAR